MNLPNDAYSPESSWPELVLRVRNGDAEAMEDLYKVISTGVRLRIARQSGGHDLNDRVHDLFITVTESIRNGAVREPERLMGYLRTVERRHLASYFDRMLRERRNASAVEMSVLRDRGASPERFAMDRQFQDVASRILGGMRGRDREVLLRFYFREQTAEEICNAMHLTGTQYRLIKSRAKARFVELCRRRLARRVD